VTEQACGADDTEGKYLWGRRRDLLVRALANRLYYLERQKILERREGLVKVASLVAGSVAIAKVTDARFIQGAVAVIFVGTCSSLVFGWGNKARESAKRAADWVALSVEIEAKGERSFSEDDVSAWAARCHTLETGEPAQNQALFESCYLRACEAQGASPTGKGKRWLWRAFRFIP
jgi:hypothetical protein